jgi:Lar family restriction alleviation protein
MIQLKPCPFCGESTAQVVEKETYHGGALYDAVCPQCARLAGYSTASDAAEVWNRRAPLTVADCLTVPEVRALVEKTNKLTDSAEWAYLPDRTMHEEWCAATDALAPFLAAMKGGQNG